MTLTRFRSRPTTGAYDTLQMNLPQCRQACHLLQPLPWLEILIHDGVFHWLSFQSAKDTIQVSNIRSFANFFSVVNVNLEIPVGMNIHEMEEECTQVSVVRLLHCYSEHVSDSFSGVLLEQIDLSTLRRILRHGYSGSLFPPTSTSHQADYFTIPRYLYLWTRKLALKVLQVISHLNMTDLGGCSPRMVPQSTNLL